MRDWWRSYVMLLAIQLREVATEATWYLLAGLALPAGVLVAAPQFEGLGHGVPLPVALVTGSPVLSLLGTTLMTLPGGIARQRERGVFQFYATLPITRSAFLASSISTYLLIGLPGLAFTFAVSLLVYPTFVVGNPWLAVYVLLAAFSLASFGVLIGLLGRTEPVASIQSNVLYVYLLLATPVILPIDRMPGIVQTVAYIWPSTYAVEAIRMLLLGHTGGQLWLDGVVLLAWGIVALVGDFIALPWRHQRR